MDPHNWGHPPINSVNEFAVQLYLISADDFESCGYPRVIAPSCFKLLYTSDGDDGLGIWCLKSLARFFLVDPPLCRGEEERLVIIRFGHDYDSECMKRPG
jgi:hypothetical protein